MSLGFISFYRKWNWAQIDVGWKKNKIMQLGSSKRSFLDNKHELELISLLIY